MLIKTLPVGQLETNCYIVTDENTLECAVIDPGDESMTVMDYVELNRLTVKAIFLTHGHYDHVGAVEAVAGETGADVYINDGDIAGEGDNIDYKYAPVFPVKRYAHGDRIDIGGLSFEVISTPGHSAGSVTLKCENVLFVGDTLFKGSCGRTDLPGGDFDTLMRSLRRLNALEGDFEVYPGHMEQTTLQRERWSNRYMKYAEEGK